MRLATPSSEDPGPGFSLATQISLLQKPTGLADRAPGAARLMSECDAEALQTQAQPANVSVSVEQVLVSKRMTASQVAVFASRAFGAPLFDLNGFDLDQINKQLVDPKLAAMRRVLPLHKRGNRLFVAVSDPANMQALDEVRFKTNLVIDPVVVEDDKLASPSPSWPRRLGDDSKTWSPPTSRPRRVDWKQPALPTRMNGGRRRRAGRQVHPEDPARRDQRRACPTSTSSPTRSSTASAIGSTAILRKSRSRRSRSRTRSRRASR